MSRFPYSPKFEALTPEEVKERGSKAQLFRMLEDFVYESDLGGRIVVPVGFVTDFASIPGHVKWYLDDDDPRILFISIIHDWLYTAKPFPRDKADRILQEGMIVSGARASMAYTVYLSVKIAGGSHWEPQKKAA